MSGMWARSARSNSASSMTTTMEAENPPFLSACATSSASSSLSSTCNTCSFPGGSSARLSSRMSHCSRTRPLLDGIAKLLEVDRFLNIAVHPQVIAGDQIPLFFGRSHNHGGNVPGARIALDLGQHLQSVDLRQLQVQQHQFRRTIERSVRKCPTTKEKVECLRAIAHHKDAVGQLLSPESMQGKIAIILIVFH